MAWPESASIMIFKNIAARCLRRGVLPLLPARSRLPFKLWLQCRFLGAEAELMHLDRLAIRRGAAIDAGANIGLYSLRMSRLFEKVYSFEIDVEGHELHLLEGAVKTIQRGRPVILVEIRDRNEAPVFRLLESLGYRRADLKELAGVPASPGNFIFVPN
jgi:hypothetical protein